MKYKRYLLSELVTIKYGKNQKKVLSADGTIPIYGTGGLMGYATEALYSQPSVLIGRKGTIGKVKYVDHPFWTVDTLFYTVVNSDIVIPKYLYYVMSQIDLNTYNEGTTIPSLRTETLNRLEFDIPSIEEQKEILSYLEPIDEKIELNNAINNNLEQQAVLLFKEWFTDFECTSGNAIETKFGKIPNTFKLLKNSELPVIVTDYVANGSFASLKANVTLYQEPNYAYFIRNTDLKSGTFEVFVDEHSYNFLSKSTLYGGEIIISNVGDVGSVFLCPKLNKPMTLGNNIIMLRFKQENLQYYLYIWFKWLYGQSLIQGIKGGSAQPKFNKTDFKNLPIFLPPDDLLEQFHQTVKPMFKLIEKNNAENQSLTVTRDTLLPKLMSGELDVSDIDI